MGRMKGGIDRHAEGAVEAGWMRVVQVKDGEPLYGMTAKGILHVEKHMGLGSSSCNCEGLCPCGNYRMPNGRFCDEHPFGPEADKEAHNG